MRPSREIFQDVKQASRRLNLLSEAEINQTLLKVADAAENHIEQLLEENQKDLDRMDPADPRYDRLKLNEERIRGIAADIRNVAGLQSPLEKVLDRKTLSNGLELEKITVPLGVIGIIYESRPNVTFDVFSLCFKSGNSCILKGGTDSDLSNRAIIQIIHQVLQDEGLDRDFVALLSPERQSTNDLLNATGFVDIIIPRGSQKLIDYVRENAKVPVIETGAGIVHTYFDLSGSLEKGKSIIFNAKTRRVSVCNALDCLIIHQERLTDLPELLKDCGKAGVEVFADRAAYDILQQQYPENLLQPAQPEHFGTEFLSMKMSVKTVENLDEALNHIDLYSSRHSEAIISEDEEVNRRFMKGVDAAAVYVNVSTAFTDGAQFGMGAEIGISTQKLHARGPMALQELTSYKWLIRGNGQVRQP
jgi:glutamate-5-semialdehyde dehydrogenase